MTLALGVCLMAHVEKYGRGATGHLTAHYERAQDAEGKYIKFGNQDICPEHTPENYNLAPQRDIKQSEFIRQRCSQVQCLKRKDVNVMCSWAVTLPAEITGDQDERKFFQETYNFLEQKYGAENVVSAYVHKDETTPHMHFAFVPVVNDRKTGKPKVSAKECLTLAELKSFHGELSRHLEQTFGRDVGILNEATRAGNKSIEELKRGTAVKELEELRQKNATMAIELSNLQKRVLSTTEVKNLAEKGKKTLLGGLKGITWGEFVQLRDTAAEVDKAQLLAVAAVKKMDIATKQLSDSKNALLEREHNITLKETQLADRREADAREHAMAMEETPNKMLLRQYQERGQELNDRKQYEYEFRKSARELISEIPAEMKKALEPKIKAVQHFTAQTFEKAMGRKSKGQER